MLYDLDLDHHPAAREALEAVLAKLPALTLFGVGVFDGGAGLSPSEYATQWRAGRTELLSDGATFVAVCDWLAGLAPSRRVYYSSYYVKHVAEAALGVYVSNGCLIGAAVAAGFPYQLHPGSPNAGIGIACASLQAQVRRHGWRP